MDLQTLEKDKSALDLKPSLNSIRNYEVKQRIESLKTELDEAIEDLLTEEDVKHPSPVAIEEAKALIQDFLPFQDPMISCLPDGGIIFQWIKRPHSIFTLSVYGEGKITYAATFRNEGDRHRGTVKIKNHSLSKNLLDFLNTHFSNNKFQNSDFQWINTSKTPNQ